MKNKDNNKTTPNKPSSSYQIGDRVVADTYWDGNKYVTKYNPTSSESDSMNILQNAIPQAYKDAINSEGIAAYKQNWIDKQTNQLNESANKNLTMLKDNLITGGQVGSSTGWNKIGKFNDSYVDALNDINTNADLAALNYQNNLLNYANSLQGAMNNYYDLSGAISQTNALNQQNAANQSLGYWNAENLANSSANSNLFGILSGTGSLLGGLGTLASGWGSTGGLAGKTGGAK